MIDKIQGIFRARNKDGKIEDPFFEFVFDVNNKKGYVLQYKNIDDTEFQDLQFSILKTSIHNVVDIRFENTSIYFEKKAYRLEFENGLLVIYSLPYENEVALYSFIEVPK